MMMSLATTTNPKMTHTSTSITAALTCARRSQVFRETSVWTPTLSAWKRQRQRWQPFPARAEHKSTSTISRTTTRSSTSSSSSYNSAVTTNPICTRNERGHEVFVTTASSDTPAPAPSSSTSSSNSAAALLGPAAGLRRAVRKLSLNVLLFGLGPEVIKIEIPITVLILIRLLMSTSITSNTFLWGLG